MFVGGHRTSRDGNVWPPRVEAIYPGIGTFPVLCRSTTSMPKLQKEWEENNLFFYLPVTVKTLASVSQYCIKILTERQGEPHCARSLAQTLTPSSACSFLLFFTFSGMSLSTLSLLESVPNSSSKLLQDSRSISLSSFSSQFLMVLLASSYTCRHRDKLSSFPAESSNWAKLIHTYNQNHSTHIITGKPSEASRSSNIKTLSQMAFMLNTC